MRQGEPGDKFYLIRQGEVEVVVDDGTSKRVVARLARRRFLRRTGAAHRRAPQRHRRGQANRPCSTPWARAISGRRIAASASLREELQKVLFERQ